ncbi:hypothetical protein CW304_09225 [Bacillus sp. UFRGS-B20]|nr:hypothetical protein CW304_09225 [Bacillus sp. UFRGS-B20]
MDLISFLCILISPFGKFFGATLFWRRPSGCCLNLVSRSPEAFYNIIMPRTGTYTFTQHHLQFQTINS